MPITTYEELLAELGRVGKLKTPLDPAGLIGRDALSACRAVAQRASDFASETDLADATGQAILSEIEAIHESEDRLIARAMFAVPEEDYGGKNVGERKDRLEELEGILSSKWDSRRNEILQRIAYGLNRGAQKEQAGDSGGTRVSDPRKLPVDPRKSPTDYRAMSRTRLAQKAAVLHYAGLTTLFVRAYDDALSRATPTRGHFHYEPTTNYLFNAYVAFVYDGVLYSIAEGEGEPPPGDLTDEELAPFVSVEAARAWSLARDGFPDNVVRRLLQLWSTVSYYSCLAPSKVTDKMRRALHHWEGELGFVPRGVDEITKALPVMALEANRDERYKAMHQPHFAVGIKCYKRWHAWLRDAPDRDIADITGAAGAFAAIFSNSNLPLETDVNSRAWLGAQKALAIYYEFDERESVFDGQSLRELASSYFDMTSAMLVKRRTV